MCSVQEEGAVAPQKLSTDVKGKKCTKCPEAAIIIIRVDHTFCKSCFLTYASHKFRSSFGKSRVVRTGEKVLVGFSGGASSTALLQLCLEGRSPRAPKKLRFQPSLVYIDEGAALGLSAEERCEANRPMLEAMERSNLPGYVYTLEQALNTTQLSSCMSERLLSAGAVADQSEETSASKTDDLVARLQMLHLDGGDLQEQLQSLLASAKTLTAKEYLIFALRQHLLLTVSRALGHTRVLVGDTSTRLASRLIANITQGRGAHAAHEMAFADARFDDVSIVRPLREFLAKEVVMFNTLNKLEPVILPTLSTKAGRGASLEKLTESFVSGLQADFPSTVSTIFRTGEKLDKSNESAGDARLCPMCHLPLDTDVGDSSALSATIFSQQLSRKAGASPCSNAQETDCCGEGDGSCGNSPFQLSAEDLNSILCYGCRLVVKDVNDRTVLPAHITEEAGRLARRQQMKSSIQDFLLEDDDPS